MVRNSSDSMGYFTYNYVFVASNINVGCNTLEMYKAKGKWNEKLGLSDNIIIWNLVPFDI